MLLDTSGVLAALYRDQPLHEECVAALEAAEPPFIISPFVLQEIDFMILKLAGVADELLFLDEVARRAYELVGFTADDISSARHLIAKYRPLKIGLADASIAVLAAKYDTYDVLTLDERHFRAVRPAPRKHFRILPADA